jgi:CHAD domain-containing protein
VTDETESFVRPDPDPMEGLIVDRPWPAAPPRRPRRPVKADPILLREAMSVAEGFETIATACLRHFRLNEPLVVESKDVEGLHQARVSMRRLRSALALFRPTLRDQKRDRIEEELDWFSAQLGDARNLDVYLERCLSPDQRLLVEEQREKAYDLAIAATKSARFRRLMHDLAGWSAAGQWRESARAEKALAPFMNRRIDKLWSKVRKSDDVAHVGDKRRHHLRIQMKKLRNALEFADALHTRKPRRKKKFMEKVKAAQESLGSLHDIVIANSLVTLNSWLLAPGPSEKDEQKMVRDADRAMRQLRKIGPYWG